jgi:CubicO group peptidase (beta-lactamase class C family)
MQALTTREVARRLAAVPLAFDPGTHWMYGLSHDILGALIEEISGVTVGVYLKDTIFDPLGMHDTGFHLQPSEQGRLASYYAHKNGVIQHKITESDVQYAPGSLYESGGAGLLSTLGDYLRFAGALANGGALNGARILGRKTIDLLRADCLSEEQKRDYNWPYLRGYSYGLGVRTLVDIAAAGANGSLGEFGWCGMAGTWTLIDPAEKLAAVYMHQLSPNLESERQPRLRAAIYAGV